MNLEKTVATPKPVKHKAIKPITPEEPPKKLSKEELAEAHGRALGTIVWKLNESVEADDDHPYLLDHDVPSYDLGLDRHGNLLGVGVDLEASFTGSAYIPKLQNLLTISRSGKTTLEPGAKPHGAALMIGHQEFRKIGREPQGEHEVLLTVNYAAGAALYRDTGKPVAVVFTLGNLKPVAAILKAKFSKAKLVFYVGEQAHDATLRAKAWEVAKAVGGLIAPYRTAAEKGFDSIAVDDAGLDPEIEVTQ